MGYQRRTQIENVISTHRRPSTRLQQLQCVSNGATAVPRQTINTCLDNLSLVQDKRHQASEFQDKTNLFHMTHKHSQSLDYSRSADISTDDCLSLDAHATHSALDMEPKTPTSRAALPSLPRHQRVANVFSQSQPFIVRDWVPCGRSVLDTNTPDQATEISYLKRKWDVRTVHPFTHIVSVISRASFVWQNCHCHIPHHQAVISLVLLVVGDFWGFC